MSSPAVRREAAAAAAVAHPLAPRVPAWSGHPVGGGKRQMSPATGGRAEHRSPHRSPLPERGGRGAGPCKGRAAPRTAGEGGRKGGPTALISLVRSMRGRKWTGSGERAAVTAVVVLLSVYVLFNLRVAAYHLATEGWKSGLAEMALSLWVMLLTYLAWEARRRHTSPSWRRTHLAARGWLAMVSLVYLALGLYHFTHRGTRSGVMESLAFLVLLALSLALA